MKTAVVCWCLFSLTFALPIPEHNSPHVNALRESNIKQNSHSSSVSYNAKSQKDSHLDENYDTEKQKDSHLDENYDTEKQKDSLLDENYDTEKQKDSLLDENYDTEDQKDSHLDENYDTEKQKDFLLDMSDADIQDHEHSHSSEGNHIAEAHQHSHSAEVNHDSEADEDSLVLNARNGIAGWQRDDLYEENYAANNPEVTDEFLGDYPQNYLTNMDKDDEDQSMEIE